MISAFSICLYIIIDVSILLFILNWSNPDKEENHFRQFSEQKRNQSATNFNAFCCFKNENFLPVIIKMTRYIHSSLISKIICFQIWEKNNRFYLSLGPLAALVYFFSRHTIFGPDRIQKGMPILTFTYALFRVQFTGLKIVLAYKKRYAW